MELIPDHVSFIHDCFYDVIYRKVSHIVVKSYESKDTVEMVGDRFYDLQGKYFIKLPTSYAVCLTYNVSILT